MSDSAAATVLSGEESAGLSPPITDWWLRLFAAFPFSPLDIAAGPVCEFNVYHLVEEEDPHRLFPQEMVDF